MSAPAAPVDTKTTGAPAAPVDTKTTGAPGQTAGRRRRGPAGSWMAHVKATMRAHKGLKLKQVLKLAKKTYKKVAKRGGGVAGGLQPSPLSGAGRHGKTRRSRRGGDTMGEY